MNIPRRALFGKLNLDLFRAIESATALAKLRGNPYVEMVHWLHQLWQIPQGDFQRLASHYGMDAAQVEKDLTVALAHLPHGATGLNDFGHAVEFAIERAWLFASLTMRDHCVRGAWLLGAMLQTPELRRLLLGISASFQRISVEKCVDDLPQAVRGSGEDGVPAHERSDCHPAVPGEASGAMDAVADGASALARYCILADWTGIPVGRMVRDDLSTVMSLDEQLRTRVVGQDAALATISARVKTAKAQLGDPHKPLGVFMLVGPSGVGKTETALALAQAVYGGEHNLITINMSEYQEAHTVSGLKGSPPGYVGYGEGGVLTEAVRRRPYSVVLLDEVEKAHPDVHELFYQVFDRGWMEDGEGRAIDFRNTLILLTSNTGSDRIHQLCDDIDLVPEPQALAEALQPELRKAFPAAFLGRLQVVPYLPLPASRLQAITALQLQKVTARMQAQHGIRLVISASAVAHIVDQCGAHETGARRIGQFIERHVLTQLAEVWLQSMHDQVVIRQIELKTEAEAAPGAQGPLTPSPKGGLCLQIASPD